MPKSMLPLFAALLLLGMPGGTGATESPRQKPATEQDARPAGPRILRHRDRIGLTDEQANAISALHDNLRTELEPNRKRMRELRQELREVLSKGYDDREVRRIAEEQGRLLAERVILRSRTKMKVRDILSEQQRIQLKALARQKARQKRMHDHEG